MLTSFCDEIRLCPAMVLLLISLIILSRFSIVDSFCYRVHSSLWNSKLCRLCVYLMRETNHQHL